ncbi:MAG: hypothetical protein AB7D24_12570 [Sphaerochaeta sp.]|uniref:hypothetical protein n=1 Tax=Sphaerochaeta sp. TaxID=1972642 RepID=UPI003D0E6050
MNGYDKRDSEKLENMMNGVKAVLESIVFKQTQESYTYHDGSTSTFYSGQPKEQIKNKIKVARALLMDIAKELK